MHISKTGLSEHSGEDAKVELGLSTLGFEPVEQHDKQ